MSFDPTQSSSSTGVDDLDEDPLNPDCDSDTFSPSRYERNSGSLPHLAADPEWIPPGTEFVATIVEDEPQSWFRRLWT